MTDDGVWDPTLFRGAAAYYRQGRQPYAPALADTFTELFSVHRMTGRLLDLGSDPGSVCVPPAHLYRTAIEIDPDPGMIIEARKFAAERRRPNTEFHELPAEILPAGLGAFDTITFGSFHWMDRHRVAAADRDRCGRAGRHQS